MTDKRLDSVVLSRDPPDHGLQAGNLGAVVLVVPSNALVMELVRASWYSQALVTPPAGAVQLVRDEDLIPSVQ